MEDPIRRAAAALEAATHVLIGAGAGMSADSGLSTYADAASVGGLSYAELCQPTALLEHPAAAYGFWATSLSAYRAAVPHEGYAVLQRLCASKPPNQSCVYTSNVDGLFRRFPALASRLHEIHGCVEEWACGSSLGFARDDGTGQLRSRGGVFEAHNSQVADRARQANGGGVGTGTGGGNGALPWDPACAAFRTSPPRGRCVAEWQARCDERLSSPAAGPLPPPTPLGAAALLVEEEEEASEDGVAWGADAVPRCPLCSSPLRPSVVMFGDTDVLLLERQAAAASAYQSWEEQMEVQLAASPPRTRMVVLEIGCGLTVPSVRRECEDVVRDVLRRGGCASLIRINPEAQVASCTDGASPPAEQDDEPLPSEHVVLIRDGALRGLLRIEEALGTY